MKCLVAVGACYLDTILTSVENSLSIFQQKSNPCPEISVEHYPAEDEKLRASKLIRRRGGNCPNALEVLEQLLLLLPLASPKPDPIALVLSAVLPSSSSTGFQQIKSSFGSMVDLTHCFYREEHDEPASSYIFKSRSMDSRTIVNYNELPEMSSKEFGEMVDGLGDETCWYHFEVGIFFYLILYHFLKKDTVAEYLFYFWGRVRDGYPMLFWSACNIYVEDFPPLGSAWRWRSLTVLDCKSWQRKQMLSFIQRAGLRRVNLTFHIKKKTLSLSFLLTILLC